jgi:hypothetical protein
MLLLLTRLSNLSREDEPGLKPPVTSNQPQHSRSAATSEKIDYTLSHYAAGIGLLRRAGRSGYHDLAASRFDGHRQARGQLESPNSAACLQ